MLWLSTWWKRPAIWGTALVLAAAIGGGIGLGRLVIAPALFASPTYGRPASSRLQTTAAVQQPVRRFKSKSVEPPVQISLVKAETPLHHRRRHRWHTIQPDVVYHASKDLPGFAKPQSGDDGAKPADSESRQESDHEDRIDHE